MILIINLIRFNYLQNNKTLKLKLRREQYTVTAEVTL